ncbi:MAG: hypothetical protein WAT19_05265, partial [Ferruginibacter sp.]
TFLLAQKGTQKRHPKSLPALRSLAGIYSPISGNSFTQQHTSGSIYFGNSTPWIEFLNFFQNFSYCSNSSNSTTL